MIIYNKEQNIISTPIEGHVEEILQEQSMLAEKELTDEEIEALYWIEEEKQRQYWQTLANQYID